MVSHRQSPCSWCCFLPLDEYGRGKDHLFYHISSSMELHYIRIFLSPTVLHYHLKVMSTQQNGGEFQQLEMLGQLSNFMLADFLQVMY